MPFIDWNNKNCEPFSLLLNGGLIVIAGINVKENHEARTFSLLLNGGLIVIDNISFKIAFAFINLSVSYLTEV